MPIIQDGHLLGVLSFAVSRPLHLGVEERELLDTLVGQAALAMRNARLFAATEGCEREASALYDVTRRLAATLDTEEILQIVSEGTTKAMESSGAGFYRWDPAEGAPRDDRPPKWDAQPRPFTADPRGRGGRAGVRGAARVLDRRLDIRSVAHVLRGQRGRDGQERVGAPSSPRPSFSGTGSTASS